MPSSLGLFMLAAKRIARNAFHRHRNETASRKKRLPAVSLACFAAAIGRASCSYSQGTCAL